MGATVRSLKSNSQSGSLFANNPATVEVLILGGGGGGATYASNAQFSGTHAGAAGGLLYEPKLLTTLGSFTITIGAGGTAATSLTGSAQNGGIGNVSTFGSLLTAFGGGAANADGTTTGSIYGGGSEAGHESLIPAIWNGGGGSRAQGTGLVNKVAEGNSGIGGGGAWSVGMSGTTQQFQGGWGGAGTTEFDTWLQATTTGVAVGPRRYIAGGGGGGFAQYYGTPYNRDNSGVGGGGYGGYGTGTNATAGAANTGGGGGGGGSNGTNASLGGAGGSGLCIIRYLTGTIAATGGTEVTSGGYRYHTFTSTGTWTRTA
jgi:hypothetical protein